MMRSRSPSLLWCVVLVTALLCHDGRIFVRISCQAFSVVSKTSWSSSHRGTFLTNRRSPSSSVVLYITGGDDDDESGGADNEWKGEVVSNTPDGVIRGHTLQNVDGSVTDWILTIDGIEADLGRFSEAVYRKIVSDAKRERFQGFRPGTIPPFLERSYRIFAMDECARETVLEALQQSNIRPFENARQEMTFENLSIPPPALSKKSNNKKKSKRKKPDQHQEEEEDATTAQDDGGVVSVADQWRSVNSIEEAVDAGWRPGQSFSFCSRNVKGQKITKEDASSPLDAAAQRRAVNLKYGGGSSM